MALSRNGFFAKVEFHGGTALRILYGLARFSEDLDFALLAADKNFNFNSFLISIKKELIAYGYDIEIQDKSKVDQMVKKAFLKDDSIGKILALYQHNRKIRIKVEVDINPPAGVNTEIKYLDFPLPFSIQVKDLSSAFAGKIHALLCRDYVKGRDWYDFIWYVSRKTPINYLLLTNALQQVGPWQNKKVKVTKDWLIQMLQHRIETVDWQLAKQDVERFIQPHEQPSLDLWERTFFLSRLEKLNDYLN